MMSNSKEFENNRARSYGLMNRFGLSNPERIGLTEQEYQELIVARDVLTALASFEEKFFGVSEGYRQVEEFVLKSTLTEMIYHRRDDATSFHSVRAEFGRLVSAFLSACRLYLDSAITDASEISAGAIHKDAVKGLISDHYDRSPYYRVMEAIRNYAQHRALPVTNVSIGWCRDNGRDTRSFRSQFFFEEAKIDGKFKSQARAEIEKLGGKVDLKASVRSYFDELCSIHGRLRKEFGPYKVKAERLILEWRKKWQTRFPSKALSAVAACQFQGGVLDPLARVAYVDP
ncbi:hypothetical protein AUC71_01730 [Methyloceanibacter marginalis]|uniref:Uncharacterized protein n=2 Tax=Methyloceanibacter marginalis TaxID=1774971 RepID=A0A1E3W9D3_9HYPH|nr:hypothetical protein AUC71_01730 [Methyloceanibacter marginalis]